MKIKTGWFGFAIILVGCIDPFAAHVPDGELSIVVDGMITDQPGPYSVEIYKSARLNSQFDNIEWIRGATVSISDDLGNSETLTEPTGGHYHTSTLRGVVGRTYVLHIATKDGALYESSPEKLLPSGDFKNLRYTFNQEVSVADDDPNHPLNGFNIYLDADLDPEQEGLVRWRWTGTFEIKTFPSLRTKPVLKAAVITFIPDPYPCSGYIVYASDPTNMIHNGECSCCYCWVNQYSDSPLLSNTRFVSDNKITQFNIAYVPASRKFFYDKYYLEVEQLSTSPVVYDFWKKVEAQGKQGSDLFQTPPATTGGNIRLISEDGPPALGVFAASSIRKQSFILFPGDIPYDLPRQDTLVLSCVEAYRNSANVKPDFW